MANMFLLALPVLLCVCFHQALDGQPLQWLTYPLLAACTLSYAVTSWAIPTLAPKLLARGMWGHDLLKDPAEPRRKVPESMGIVVAAVYLLTLSLFGPVLAFQTASFHAAYIGISSMVLLGFVDDVLDLRWSLKIVLSMWSTVPLLSTYWLSAGPTNIIVPIPLRPYLGFDIELSFLYLVYMLLWAVFFTNAINIYAGVNGLEVGQTVVITIAIMIHNCIESTALANDPSLETHVFSFAMMAAFLSPCLALLSANWFPSRVFVGDTFTYLAGMSLATAGILGRFSKTLMLFFTPQLINFALSLPQLLRIIPCPRHRLPHRNPTTGLIEYSRIPETGGMNLTLINLWLRVFGPRTEQRLAIDLLALQVAACCVGFTIRYHLAQFLYDDHF